MDIWTCDCFPIDSGLVKKAVRNGQTDALGRKLFAMERFEDCHDNGTPYKIALFSDGITPQTETYPQENEISNASYPNGGVLVDIYIDKSVENRRTIFIRNDISIDVAASYGLLYNAINNKALMAFRLRDGETFQLNETRLYT